MVGHGRALGFAGKCRPCWPEHQAALDSDRREEQGGADQADVEDQREHPRRVELRGRDPDELAEALAAAQELAG